jgi:hypothetical protein
LGRLVLNPSRCSDPKLEQYEELFEEKVDLFVAPQAGACDVERQDAYGFENQRVFPRSIRNAQDLDRCRRKSESVICAARQELPLMLAICGDPKRFIAYRFIPSRADKLGKPVLPIGSSPGYVAKPCACTR